MNIDGENALEDTTGEKKSLKEFHPDIEKATYQIMLDEIPSYARTCTELNIEDFIPKVLLLDNTSFETLPSSTIYQDSKTGGRVRVRFAVCKEPEQAQEHFITDILSYQDISTPYVDNEHDVGDIRYSFSGNRDHIIDFSFVRNNVYVSIMVYRPISVPIEDIAKDIDDYILSQIQ